MVTARLLTAAAAVAVTVSGCTYFQEPADDMMPSTVLSGGTAEATPFDPVAADAALHRDAEGWQSGRQPYPGVRIVQSFGADTNSCGVTAAVKMPDGGAALLTVWHCDESWDTPVATVPTAGETNTTGFEVGHFARSGGLEDIYANVAVVQLDPGVELAPDAGMVAGLRITGVMSEAEVDKLPKRTTTICISASRTGVQCGPLTGVVDDGIFVNFARQLQHGDSGSPLFIAHDDGTATLVAAAEISGITRGPAEAQVIAPSLERLGLRIVTG